MKDEVWKPIDWVDEIPVDKYSVSNLGRVRNNYTYRILSLQRRQNGLLCCLIFPREKTARKRRIINYTIPSSNDIRENKPKFVTVHMAVAHAFIPIPDELKSYNNIRVRHIDGNNQNNEVDNLEWFDPYPNSHEPKNLCPNRKLSENDVIAICRLLVEEKGLIRNVMKRLPGVVPNVTRGQVESIKYKYHYSNISDKYFWYDTREFIIL